VKTVKILVGTWILLIVLVVAIIVTNPTAASDPEPSTGHQVVSDLGQLDMLNSDLRMLQRMRSAETSNMVTMIETNRMWTDPDMIRRQEEFQVQLDRMIGKPLRQP